MDGEAPWGGGELILSKKEATCVMGGPLLFAPPPLTPAQGRGRVEQGGWAGAGEGDHNPASPSSSPSSPLSQV